MVLGKIHVATAQLFSNTNRSGRPRHPHVGARVEGIDLNEISETEILKILGPALEKYGILGGTTKHPPIKVGPGCFPKGCVCFLEILHIPPKMPKIVLFLNQSGAQLKGFLRHI